MEELNATTILIALILVGVAGSAWAIWHARNRLKLSRKTIEEEEFPGR